MNEVSCFGCFGGDVRGNILEMCFREVMDVVLEFLSRCSNFAGDGNDGFEEGGEFLRRKDDERDSAEDDEFLPTNVKHDGILGGGMRNCKGETCFANEHDEPTTLRHKTAFKSVRLHLI